MSMAVQYTAWREARPEADSALARRCDRTEPSDAELAGRAQTGDCEAFERLVRRYRNMVFALCFRLVGRREDAWDLSQDVFLKAYKGLKGFRGEASFKTWLMRITANRCKDFLKKRRLTTVAYEDALRADEAPSPAPDPSRALEANEVGAAIAGAVQALSPKHRTAFVLREIEGLAYEEMARVMGCTLGTVMSRLHYARKKIQAALLRQGVVEEMHHE